MKKYSFSLFLVLILIQAAFSQSPQFIPYQAVARDASGSLIENQAVSLRLSIHDLSATGTVVYQEVQTATTSKLGLFNLNVGQGTSVTGTFSTINWASGTKYLQVELDPSGGSSYQNMGTSQMMSVPYALYANSASPGGTASGDLSGTYPNPTVSRINGNPLGSTIAGNGNVLLGNGSQWVSQTVSGDATLSGIGVLTLKNTGTAGIYGSSTIVPVFTTDAQGRVTSVTNTTISGTTPGGSAGGDLSGSYPNPSVIAINGNALGLTTPTAGNLLIGSGSLWQSQAMSGDGTISSTGVFTLGSISNNYIKNQTGSTQSAGFNINGTGTVGGLFTAGSAKVTNLAGTGNRTVTADNNGNLVAVLNPSTNVTPITSVGSNNFTVPANVYYLKIYLVGGGAGSVACSSQCGNGGSGAWVSGTLPVVPGEILTVVVGSGGAGAPAGGTTGGGNGTYISRGGTLLCAAGGGGGGSYGTSSSQGGGGGTGTIYGQYGTVNASYGNNYNGDAGSSNGSTNYQAYGGSCFSGYLLSSTIIAGSYAYTSGRNAPPVNDAVYYQYFAPSSFGQGGTGRANSAGIQGAAILMY